MQESNNWDARGKSNANMDVPLLDLSMIVKGRLGTSATSGPGKSTQGIDFSSSRDLHGKAPQAG